MSLINCTVATSGLFILKGTLRSCDNCRCEWASSGYILKISSWKDWDVLIFCKGHSRAGWKRWLLLNGWPPVSHSLERPHYIGPRSKHLKELMNATFIVQGCRNWMFSSSTSKEKRFWPTSLWYKMWEGQRSRFGGLQHLKPLLAFFFQNKG